MKPVLIAAALVLMTAATPAMAADFAADFDRSKPAAVKEDALVCPETRFLDVVISDREGLGKKAAYALATEAWTNSEESKRHGCYHLLDRMPVTVKDKQFLTTEVLDERSGASFLVMPFDLENYVPEPKPIVEPPKPPQKATENQYYAPHPDERTIGCQPRARMTAWDGCEPHRR